MDRRERRYRTTCHVRRQTRLADQWGLINPHPTFYAHNDPESIAIRVVRSDDAIIGRCKKTNALDCGHTRCYMCGRGKYVGRNGRILTRQEFLSWFGFREQAAELAECFPKPV